MAQRGIVSHLTQTLSEIGDEPLERGDLLGLGEHSPVQVVDRLLLVGEHGFEGDKAFRVAHW